jgi:pimeloyl-ACP methyl ester carboxylesterase
MEDTRIHQAISDDGTRIVGRVYGDGPPLVLVPGGPGDGDTSWRFLAPLLAERFTCYCPSTRGKGLSADHRDHSQDRLVADVMAFVDSIGEPVGLMGHSSGGVLALEATARSEAVTALALYEPAIFEELTEEHAARCESAITRAERAAREGRLTDASRIFFEDLALANDEELPVLEQGGVHDLVGGNIPALLRQIAHSGLPRLSNATVPAMITTPVLIVQGSNTHPFYAGVVPELAERLSDVQMVTVDGAGHLGPQLVPEPVAEELTQFFAGVFAAA